MDLFVELKSFRAINDDEERRNAALKLFAETKDKDKVDKLCLRFLSMDKAAVLLKDSEINLRFKNRNFENFKAYNKTTETALQKAKEYVEKIDDKFSNCVNLFITGNGKVGTGKTHLACSIANALMRERGIPCMFINVTNMIEDLKENFKIKPYVDVPILIIDDLGKETGTQWACTQIYAILNSRYEQMKPTIITIEDDLTSLQSNYGKKGKAILSRLKEFFNLITLDCDDYRQRRE
jgi:DNA replication protein DnaC